MIRIAASLATTKVYYLWLMLKLFTVFLIILNCLFQRCGGCRRFARVEAARWSNILRPVADLHRNVEDEN